MEYRRNGLCLCLLILAGWGLLSAMLDLSFSGLVIGGHAICFVFLVLYEAVAALGRLTTIGGDAERGGEELPELRAELALVAGFLSAEKVAHATHAIDLLAELADLLLDLKSEEVRKKALEEIEVLKAEVSAFIKEARRCGEETRVAGLLASVEEVRRTLKPADCRSR